MLKVRDLMTSDVVTVRPTTPIKDVAKLLVEHRISGMPVVDPGGRLIGVVSEGDLLFKEHEPDSIERRPLARIFGDSAETRSELNKVLALTAGDAMTTPAITISAEAPIAEAAGTMTRSRVNRLPVVEGETLVGVISRADVVRAIVQTDEALAKAIREDVLYRTLWLDPDRFNVVVTNGEARISGEAERRSEADMIERVTAMVPGVISVSTQLTWKLDDRGLEAPERDLVSSYKP